MIANCSLKFHQYVDQLVGKALIALFIIFRHVYTRNPNTLLLLHKTYVLTLLEFCTVIWSHVSRNMYNIAKEFNRFSQNSCFTSVFRTRLTPTLANYKVRLEKSNSNSLLNRRVINNLVFCFRILRKELRHQASKYWTQRLTFGRNSILVLHNRHKKTPFQHVLQLTILWKSKVVSPRIW